MPITQKKKAIRFKSFDKMTKALERDDLFQQRHVALRHLAGLEEKVTRRELCEQTGLPINSICRVISQLIQEGAVYEAGYKDCEHSGVSSRTVMYDHSFKGPF